VAQGDLEAEDVAIEADCPLQIRDLEMDVADSGLGVHGGRQRHRSECRPRASAGEATAALARDAARRSTAKERQQLLATMVLMGVNRAVGCE